MSKRKGQVPKRRRKKRFHGATYYVYALRDPRNDQIFYIGKGCRDRCYHHMWEAERGTGRGKNAVKIARIRDIIAAGHEVGVDFLHQYLTESAALEAERLEIARAKDKLSNVSPGHSSPERNQAVHALLELRSFPRFKDWAVAFCCAYNRKPTREEYQLYFTMAGLLMKQAQNACAAMAKARPDLYKVHKDGRIEKREA
jgi:hypothetical protein